MFNLMDTPCRLFAVAAIAAAMSTLAAEAALASEADYIRLFNGAWGGSGVVVNDAKPWPVNCNAVGVPAANRLAIRASCHVFLVISVNINVDVTYNPQSDRYSGTYSAGDMSAAISGKRTGDTVNFAMIWAKPIDSAGNTRGRLTIINRGRGNFQLLIDNLKKSSAEERTTDVILGQS
jgi:hypothetical protein